MTAELLRRAADLIEQRATAASCGPWVADSMCPCSRDGEEYDWCEDRDNNPTVHTLRGPGRGQHVVSYEVADFHSSAGNVAWASSVGPQVAAPLVAWLRATADAVRAHPPLLDKWAGGPDAEYHSGQAAKAALVVARTVLGEQP